MVLLKKKERIVVKRAQIWVETVVYTLIGLAILGTVLGIATPKIKEMNDQAVIEQTLSAMNSLNQKISNIQVGAGNSRLLDFRTKKGKLVLDGINDIVYFRLEDTGLLYSDPGVVIPQGELSILTTENGKHYNIDLILNYTNILNITFNSQDVVKELTPSTNPYSILVKNLGGGNTDFTVD